MESMEVSRARLFFGIEVGLLTLVLRIATSRVCDGCGAVEEALKSIFSFGTVLTTPCGCGDVVDVLASRTPMPCCRWLLFTMKLRVVAPPE